MTTHSPEAIAAYPDSGGIAYGDILVKRTAYDRGVQDEAARKHAAEREAIIDALVYTLSEQAHAEMVADALLAPGGPLVDVREVQAQALEELIARNDFGFLSKYDLRDVQEVINQRAAEIREAR